MSDSPKVQLATFAKFAEIWKNESLKHPPAAYGVECFRRMISDMGMFTCPLTAEPPVNKLFGIEITEDSTIPRGMGMLVNEKGDRVWFDCRTDEEKANEAAE